MKSTHSDRLQRWLGDEKVNEISRAMKGWYGPPIHILDVPGSVRVCGDGDFIGDFDRGFYATAADAFREVWMRMGRVQHGQMNVGFASIGDALLRSSSGYGQTIPIAKAGATGVQFASSTLWRVGNTPSAGSAGAAAAGGTAHVSSIAVGVRPAVQCRQDGEQQRDGSGVRCADALPVHDCDGRGVHRRQLRLHRSVHRARCVRAQLDDVSLHRSGERVIDAAFGDGQQRVHHRPSRPADQHVVRAAGSGRRGHQGVDADAVQRGDGHRHGAVLYRPSARVYGVPGGQYNVAIRLVDEPQPSTARDRQRVYRAA
jgi:hypothetical protein